MENKLHSITNNNRAKKALCALRGVIGEALIAGLAVAYISEHIGQIPHQAGLAIALSVVGLVLYFAKANQVK